MDLRQIQYFVALYEERSITRAAKRLHVVQPAVSMQIRKIEMDCGFDLFERTAQGVNPNALAQQLYPLCQKVLGDLNAARNFLREAKGRVAGSLSVGVPPSTAHSCLADVIADFAAQYPDVRLSVREGYSAQLFEWLADGVLEVAIVIASEGERRVQLSPLLTEELVVVMAKATAAGRTGLAGLDLAGLRLVLPSGENFTRLLIENELGRESLALQPAVELDSLSAVLNLMHRPGWATILPRSVASGRRFPGELQWLRLERPAISRTLAVATQQAGEMSLAAKLFVGQLEVALKLATGSVSAHQPT